MPREFDLEDDEYRFQHHEDDDSGASCRRCGATGLTWVGVTQPDGRSEKRRLVDGRMRPHVCRATASDFEVL